MTLWKRKPPLLANMMLRLFLNKEDFTEKSGDLEEVYISLSSDYGIFRTKIWYWGQVLATLPRLLSYSVCWRIQMTKNYFKVTLRNMQRQKVYAFINISGLAVGMACCLLIFLYVRDELSFEDFHKNSSRIYRTIIDEYVDGKWEHNVGSPDLLGPALQKEFPEVIAHVRLFNPNWVDKWSVARGDKYFYEDNLFFADPTIFEVFTFPLLQGNPNTALQEPNSMIITKTMAQKYFGKDDPVGKVLTINDTVKARITGIARDVPENTHFRFDFLVSFESMPYKWALNTWKTMQFFTYIILDRDYSQVQWEKKLSDFLHKNFGKHANIKLHFQPIEDIHLHSRNYNSDLAANKSDIAYIFIFSTIVFFILGIACINFMNLSTARSAKRAKEVGVRKVVGAHRGQLIKQFLGESLVFSFFAGILAIFLVKIFLPAFNSVSGKNITFSSENIFLTGGILAGIILVVGFISGSYPSLFLSAFQPIKVLKGMLLEEKKSVLLRRILVVFQFTISLCLIIGTFIIHGQIDFCINKNLGFEKDHVVVLPVRSNDFQMKYDSFRITLLNNPRFISVAGSSTVPGRPVGERGMFPEGNVWHPRNSIFVDYDFLPTFGIEIKEGRNFSRDFPTDADDAYIVNEAAVKNFGWDQAINKKIFWAGDKNKKGHVIGVVKDFHYKSFHQEIEPLVLHMTRGGRSYISVRVSGKYLTKTMSFLKNKWLEFNPGHPFDYFFLDDNFDKLYRAEEKMGKIIRYFTFLTLFISCLGLFGLASYILEQRTKEIGIRKVLGASSAGIVVLLSKEFLRWVLIANILAWPIVYFAMNRWLQNFAYRTNISVWVFFFSAAIVMLISLVTISYQSIKTAAANPVDSLRYE